MPSTMLTSKITNPVMPQNEPSLLMFMLTVRSTDSTHCPLCWVLALVLTS